MGPLKLKRITFKDCYTGFELFGSIENQKVEE